MTKYAYVVESTTETGKLSIKVFSSQKATERYTKMLPKLKHVIKRYEFYNINSF